MPWIKTIEETKAEGLLKRIYSAAQKRAGKVYNVLKIQSIRPDILKEFMALYTAVVHKSTALTRAQCEMIAVVVSATNHCRY